MNNYVGVVIEESLKDTSVLEALEIQSTKVEPITTSHQTPWLTQWTLHTVQISESRADEIAQKIQVSLDTDHAAWYADFKNDQFHYIIYADKIIKVDLKNPVLYKDAREHGISLGIPEYQVNFTP